MFYDDHSLTSRQSLFSSTTPLSWLVLGITALALSGIFSILLVLARTPQIQPYLPFSHFFHTALVVHVDLSVLVWLLSMTALLATVPEEGFLRPTTARASFGLSWVGMLLMAISPFTGEGFPLMSNYIPVLQNLCFFIGLSSFLWGIAMYLLLGLTHRGLIVQLFTLTRPLISGIYGAVIITLLAYVAFIFSYFQLRHFVQETPLAPEVYYEWLFWGGGHILQFAFVQIMMIAWIRSLTLLNIPVKASPTILISIFIGNLLLALPALLIYSHTTIDSAEHTRLFTAHMRHLGGIAPIFMSLIIIASCMAARKHLTNRSTPFILSALFASLTLFLVGGFIGYLIVESNVTIPAHYHGSIVGISLALMGLAYGICEHAGYPITQRRLAFWQPILYGAGQLLHITGLAWSGGYGALRKTPGSVPTYEAKIALGFMGAGGLLAIIGGLFFVMVCINAFRHGRNNKQGIAF